MWAKMGRSSSNWSIGVFIDAAEKIQIERCRNEFVIFLDK